MNRVITNSIHYRIAFTLVFNAAKYCGYWDSTVIFSSNYLSYLISRQMTMKFSKIECLCKAKTRKSLPPNEKMEIGRRSKFNNVRLLRTIVMLPGVVCCRSNNTAQGIADLFFLALLLHGRNASPLVLLTNLFGIFCGRSKVNRLLSLRRFVHQPSAFRWQLDRALVDKAITARRTKSFVFRDLSCGKGWQGRQGRQGQEGQETYYSCFLHYVYSSMR